MDEQRDLFREDTGHVCDICGKPARKLMWGGQPSEREVWYCAECANDYADELNREQDEYDYSQTSCPECNGTGLDWGGMPCEHCDGYGYYWWE